MNFTALPTLGDLVSGVRMLTRLPPILRRPLTSEEARATLHDHLMNRERNFLTLARDGIYGNSRSPYRRLLESVGCAYGDLERLVQKEGLESALHSLYTQGIYLTVDEYKGRRPVVRGQMKFLIGSADLHNPGLRLDMFGRTSSSRGPGTVVPMDYAAHRKYSADVFLEIEARGGWDWQRAIWLTPGSGALSRVMGYTFCGTRLDRWFFLVEPKAAGLHPRYFRSAQALRLAAKLAGVWLPRPEFVGLQDPLPIARWIEGVLRAGKTPHLQAYASCVVRICQTALERGINLKGARFTMGGEPITAARFAIVRQVGAEALVRYATSDASVLGLGCAAPQAPDDVHFLHDRCAMVQPGANSAAGLPPNTLLLTTVRPKARLILFNVSLGDQAVVSQRDCGCSLEKLGWTRHLHTIRSFEKLTAGGVALLDADIVGLLEETLPRRFGGGPTDYQLIDEESPDGKPRVRLLVHPRLGPMDPAEVRKAFLDGIGPGSGAERVMMLVWRDAGLPIIERKAPRVTSGGKILHVHLDRPNRLSVNNAD